MSDERKPEDPAKETLRPTVEAAKQKSDAVDVGSLNAQRARLEMETASEVLPAAAGASDAMTPEVVGTEAGGALGKGPIATASLRTPAPLFRRAYAYAVAAVAVALVGYAWTSGLFASSDNVSSLPQGKGADSASFAQARQLRFDAGDALDKSDWKKALDLFDRAKAIDPAGEGVPWIEHGRALAREGLSRPAPESPKP